MITVYEKTTRCSMCDAVKRDFDAKGVEYTLLPIDDEVLEFARAKDFKSAPIVVSDERPELNFCGYNPSIVKDFIVAHKGA